MIMLRLPVPALKIVNRHAAVMVPACAIVPVVKNHQTRHLSLIVGWTLKADPNTNPGLIDVSESHG